MDDSATFIATVFGDPFPKGARIELWSKKKGARSIATASAAQSIVPADRIDLYVAVGYTAAPPQPKARTTAAGVIGIPALWIDLDVIGGADGKGGRTTTGFATREDALECAHSVEAPTVIVDSGYGVHAWWVFDEPWIFQNDLDRQRAQRVIRAWQDRHREKAPGVKIDSTHDLARLMRLPGTLNGKDKDAEPVAVHA